MGSRRASSLTATDLATFLEAKRTAGCKPSYLSRVGGVVQSMLNWAAAPQPGRTPERLLSPGNPVKGMLKPNIPAAPERFAETAVAAAFLRGWLRRVRGRYGSPGVGSPRRAEVTALGVLGARGGVATAWPRYWYGT